LGTTAGFSVTPYWMRQYRTAETAHPLANCEVVELTGT
jgi:hypothetical protein